MSECFEKARELARLIQESEYAKARHESEKAERQYQAFVERVTGILNACLDGEIKECAHCCAGCGKGVDA